MFVIFGSVTHAILVTETEVVSSVLLLVLLNLRHKRSSLQISMCVTLKVPAVGVYSHCEGV